MSNLNTIIRRYRVCGGDEPWKFKEALQLFPMINNSGIEVLTCVIKNEVNKAGTLEMDVIVNSGSNTMFRPYLDFIVVYDYYEGDDVKDVLFFGRIISVTMDNNQTSHITCEGYLACLADAPMTSHNKSDPFTIPGNGWLQSRFSIAVESYAEQLGRNDVWWRCNYAEQYATVEEEVNISPGTSCGDFILNTLVSTYGGVLYLERPSKNCIPFGKTKLNVVWQDGPDANINLYNQSDGGIRWGVNMLDASYESTQDEIFTGILPWYSDYSSKKQKYTYYKKNGHLYPIFYTNGTLTQKYGLIIKSVGFDNVKNPTSLAKKAKRWIKTNLKDYGSQYTFKAIDLHYLTVYDADDLHNPPMPTEVNYNLDNVMANNGHSYTKRIHVLDRVYVSYPPNLKRIDTDSQRNKMICTSAEYDLFHPENDSFVIGPVIPPDMTNVKFVTKKKK